MVCMNHKIISKSQEKITTPKDSLYLEQEMYSNYKCHCFKTAGTYASETLTTHSVSDKAPGGAKWLLISPSHSPNHPFHTQRKLYHQQTA